MATGRAADQLIVIVGPTASGKSDTAMRVAQRHRGEIICADSRTVYRDLDIGTAKPSAADRALVPHHALDIIEPGQTFNAATFQQLATQAIADIQMRGKLPIIVGGTGLFVDGVLFDYQFGASGSSEIRAELEAKSVEELQQYCNNRGIELPNNSHNKRHLVRAIEQQGINRRRNQAMRANTFVIGVWPDKATLYKRITARVELIFQQNVVDEATKVAKIYGWNAPGLSGNIYPIIRRLLAGDINQAEAVQQFIKADWQLARRQMTWFRRNSAIQWRETPAQAEQLIDHYLTSGH